MGPVRRQSHCVFANRGFTVITYWTVSLAQTKPTTDYLLVFGLSAGFLQQAICRSFTADYLQVFYSGLSAGFYC
jgi:hypothetical protein